MLKINLYNYKGIVERVVDGDTIILSIDLGLDVWLKKQVVRLAGINAPEIVGKNKQAGLKAKKFLEELLPKNTPVVVKTSKDKKEKYGRYLATIFKEDVEVNKEILLSNNGIEYK